MKACRAPLYRRRNVSIRRVGPKIALPLAMATLVSLSLVHTAHAQTRRLETIVNWNGSFYHRSSLDDGINWTVWDWVSSTSGNTSERLTFSGPPGIASQREAMYAVAKTTRGTIVSNGWSPAYPWGKWYEVSQDAFPGGVRIGGRNYYWNTDSYPALTTWGGTRFDVFMHATRADDGAIALLHTWSEDWLGLARWRGSWEVLGTGRMRGSPMVAAWAPGRLDVLVRGGSNDLSQRTFANSRWSAWSSVGGCLRSSPAVTPLEAGNLYVAAVGCDGQMQDVGYVAGRWWGFSNLGGSTVEFGTHPAVASAGPGRVDLFTAGADGYLHHRAYREGTGWTERTASGITARGIAAHYWTY
jgi:hypothetical protein